jgi:hypothetical protein
MLRRNQMKELASMISRWSLALIACALMGTAMVGCGDDDGGHKDTDAGEAGTGGGGAGNDSDAGAGNGGSGVAGTTPMGGAGAGAGGVGGTIDETDGGEDAGAEDAG